MPDDNTNQSYQKRWNFFPSEYTEDLDEKITRSKAETACLYNEDRRKEERHIADLLHMLTQIEKAKAETLSYKVQDSPKALDTFNAASTAIQKYLEIAMKTSAPSTAGVVKRSIDENVTRGPGVGPDVIKSKAINKVV